MEKVLTINKLYKSYSDFSLNNINLELMQGDIMGLIGENGAGKTTLMKLLLNLLSPEKGELIVFNKSYVDHSSYIKNRIGVVFDENYLHGLLTPKQINLIMSSIYERWNQKTYYYYLENFNLPLNKKINEFSKGMKVKLNFSVALSHKPELLLLDEATSGLDPVMRIEILDVLKEYVTENNSCVLISSHILSDVERIANKITFMHKGKIVFTENVSNITQHGNLENIMRSYIKGESSDARSNY